MRKLLFGFMFIALVAIPYSGCVSKPAPKGTPQKSANPLDALTKFFSALGKVKSYRTKTTMIITGPDIPDSLSGPQEITMEFVAPDRIHMITISKQFESEQYMIAGTSYSKVKGIAGMDQWQKTSIPESLDYYSSLDPKKMQANLKALLEKRLLEKRYIGPKVLDGKPMLVYEYKGSDVTEGKTSTTTFKIWIGVTDSLPHRIESTMKSDTMNIEGVTTYYDYNANITIDPPIQ